MERSVDLPYPKRVLRLSERISGLDPSRIYFPQGLVRRILPCAKQESSGRVEIPLRTPRSAGILRKIAVGYASDQKLLSLADLSGGFVEMRIVIWRRKHDAEPYRHELLLLKQFRGDTPGFPTDSLLLADVWMENVGLLVGDEVLVSNTMTDYLFVGLSFKVTDDP